MADPTRLKILHALQGGELCVSDVLTRVGGSQANVSKHLSVLRHAGLVGCRRAGVNVYYRIQDRAVFNICAMMCDTLERHAKAERRTIESGRVAMLAGER
jgi:DNA-binding transcriptional ArsR family regulator